MKRILAALFAASALTTGACNAQALDVTLAHSFDEGSGNVVRDASGHGFTGKVAGAVWVKGKHGSALEFDGVDDLVEIPDAPGLRVVDGGTIMAWTYVKTSKGHAAWPRILIKAANNGGLGGYDFLLDRAAGYAVRFCVGGECNSHAPVTTDSWNHIAATFDGKTIRAYVNGEKIGELPQIGPAVDTPEVPLIIGNSKTDGRPFQGILDEIRIAPRAFDADEIAWHMERGSVAVFSVDPNGRLATAWGAMKRPQ